MKYRYLVTGATGFVGSSLVKALIEKNEDVSVIVRNKNLNSRLSDSAYKLHIYEGNLQDPHLEKIIEKIKPHIVFHLAAHGALPGEKVTIEELLDTNLNGLIRLISATKKNNLKLFVNTGSSSEYGIKEKPMKESDLLAPLNDYGISKAAATLYCQKIGIIESLPIITLRLFSPYGYQDDMKRLIPFVINRALRNESISLSSKKNVRDFIYIEDVISAYMATIEKSFVLGEILNIGSGKQHSVYDIVSHIIEITKSKSTLDWNTMPQQSRQVEPKIWQADIQKAEKYLKWKPRYSLAQGLERTIKQYQQQND